MKTKAWLDVVDVSSGFAVAWHDEDDGEGAHIGQDSKLGRDALVKTVEKVRSSGEIDDYEYFSLELAALDAVSEFDVTRAIAGYVFGDLKDAKKFLGRMKTELKAARESFKTGRPWPAWAKEAAANGWKPPKGWTP